MNSYTMVLNYITRSDLRGFFSTCIQESTDLLNLTVDALEQQGLYIRSPRVEYLKNNNYINNQNFLNAGLFGKKRNLLAGEITAIFASLRQNKIGAALITGFAQVAQSPMLKEYLFRGRDLSWKKVEKLNQFFIDEHIPIPSSSDSFVTDSVIAPFSDKLMAVNILFLQTASIQQDCFGFTNSLRHDLLTYFAGSALETGKYAEDGVDILIKNRWLEQSPQVIESAELVKV